MRASFFDIELSKLLKHEGGYANHPNDPGGETNYGITKRTAVAHGYTGDMRLIPLSIVAAIYRKSYWEAIKLDDIVNYDKTLASIMFDFCVNAGADRSAKALQRVVCLLGDTVVIDGKIGPKTIAALNKINKEHALEAFRALRTYHYIEITEKNQKLKSFTKGWFNRIVTSLKTV